MVRAAVRVCLLPILCLPAMRASADVVQWDFDGDLESTTGHAALVEEWLPIPPGLRTYSED